MANNGFIVRSSINPKLVLCTDGEFHAQGVHTGPGTGKTVNSSINPKLVLCTDGEFHAQGVHTGPGTGKTVKVYKRESAALKFRGGVGITVEAA